MDLTVDRNTSTLTGKTIYAPTLLRPTGEYEGYDAAPNPDVVAVADQAREFVAQIKRQEIGIRLETPFVRTDGPESALGNLYTDAMLGSFDADIAIHTVNSSIRADLPAGELTFGSMFEMSPFDNRITIIELSGAELRQVISEQAHKTNFRIGFSGMRVAVACLGAVMTVEMKLVDERIIQDSDVVSIVIVDYLALGGDRIFQSVMPEGGYELQADAPLARDAIIGWLRERGGTISASEFLSDDHPKWNLPSPLDNECHLISK